MCASCCPPPAPGSSPEPCISSCCGYCATRDARFDKLAGHLQAAPPVGAYLSTNLSLDINAAGGAHGVFSAKRKGDAFYAPFKGTVTADGTLEVEGARGGDKFSLRGKVTAEGVGGKIVAETAEGERFEAELLPAHGSFQRNKPDVLEPPAD